MSSSRNGTKYRPSLSCSVCRRRKVRCGKEEPACGNCVRMNEVCEYDRALGMGERSNERSSGVVAASKFDIPIIDKRFVARSSPMNSASTVSRKRTRSPSEPVNPRELRDSHLVETTYTSVEPISVSRTPNIRGLFSYQDKLRPRFVESTYWGFVPGKESICEELLSQEHRKPNSRTPLLDVAGLFGSVSLMPTKPVSEALFSSFMIGVRPLHCLIHEPSLQAAFDASFTAMSADSRVPRGCIMTDPTLICLVHSVLYCGALVAQPSTWKSPVLKDLHRETTIEHLSRMFYASLEHSQYTKIPTLNSLSALLLVRSCAKKPTESPLEDMFFVNMVVRMAESMGLHREDAVSKMDIVPRELSRRVWWHIRWLDVQSSVLSGSEISCGCSESLFDTKTLQAMTANDDVNHGSVALVGASRWVEGSISRLFTVGRFESARFQRSLLYVVRELDQMECNRIASLVDALNKFHIKMDTLITQIPADGIPERGMIPSRLANASPLTHERLYVDNASEPTVFSSWTRIALSIFKAESAIMLHKLLLGRKDFSEEGPTWDTIIDYCLSILRNFLQLVQTQAFQPYMWFSRSRCAPLLAMNLSILYLQRTTEPEKKQLVRYFVDEVIDFHAPVVSKAGDGALTAVDTIPAAWKMLRKSRDKLDEQFFNRQSLDDLATEALASSLTSTVVKGTLASQEREPVISHPDHNTVTYEDKEVTEPSEQEIAEQFAATGLMAHVHEEGLCSEGFDEISQDFFNNIQQPQ